MGLFCLGVFSRSACAGVKMGLNYSEQLSEKSWQQSSMTLEEKGGGGQFSRIYMNFETVRSHTR